MSKLDTSRISETDFAALDAMEDEDIDFSDNPEVTAEMLVGAVVRRGLKSVATIPREYVDCDQGNPVTDKDEVADRLIDWHFQVDPKTTVIYRFISRGEDRENEPIKLLEVNEATLETGRVDAFGFGSGDDIPYSSVVAQVTTNELERIRRNEIALPAGWRLDRAVRYRNRRNGHSRDG